MSLGMFLGITQYTEVRTVVVMVVASVAHE